jgi:hypothetical protein
MADFPTDMVEMFEGGHRRLHFRSQSHLRHGQKNRPVQEWKKHHYARESLDFAVSSNSRKSDEKKSTNTNNRSEGTQDIDGRKSDDRKSTSTNHRDDGTQESHARDSPSVSDASYSSAREQATETPDTGSVISRASASTTDEGTHELKTLSLENTIHRQQSREKSIEFRDVFTDAKYHVSRAGKRMLNWALLIPADVTLSFSKGFHNAPKLYHDPMVQDTPTVRGVRGGFRAAGTVSTSSYTPYDQALSNIGVHS